jgi:hypothetical protein
VAAIHRQLPLVKSAVAPWSRGRAYMNFAEDGGDPSAFYAPDAYRRLRALRTQVDPDGLFHAHHRVPTLERPHAV